MMISPRMLVFGLLALACKAAAEDVYVEVTIGDSSVSCSLAGSGAAAFWGEGVSVHRSDEGEALVTQFQGNTVNCCIVDEAVLEVEGVDPCTATYECPVNFGMYGDHCFAFSKYKVWWETAQDHCKALNPDAHLVRPTTKEIDDYVISQISSTQDNFWNDVNCIGDKDRKFTYTNGEELSYTNWGSDEPNEGGTYCVYRCDEECSQYFYGRGHAWNDENCDSMARFVCQMDRSLNQANFSEQASNWFISSL